MAKKIDSDFINQRLRGGQNSAHQRRAPAAQQDEADETTLTKGFLAAVVCLTLTVGGGTYFLAGSDMTLESLMDGTGSGTFISQADAECRDLWVPNAKNTPAIVCYLTTNVARLCDPREKKHLAKVMKQYRLDRHSFDSQMVFAGMKAAVVMQNSLSTSNVTGMFKAIDEVSREGGPGPSVAGVQAFESHMKTLQKLDDISSSGSLEAALELEHIPDKELVKKIRRLGTEGYMTKGDFGWMSDELVGSAFEKVQEPKSSCDS